MSEKDIIICRCEDVTLEDIHRCLDQGYTTFEELKRILRVGMGKETLVEKFPIIQTVVCIQSSS